MEVFLNRTYMKRTTYLLLAAAFFSLMSFSSCERDKYLDWKYLNQSWYNEHKNDEGWNTTESGLQYKIINEGIGDKRPNSKSGVLVTYSGTYINGKEFDSAENSYLTVSGVVSGFGEALKLMKQNAIYEIRVPYEIGYGEDGNGAIPPYTTLIFRITLNQFWTE